MLREENKAPRIQLRDLREGNWYWIPKEILEKYGKKIRALGLAVYNALAYFSDQDQRSFPSQKYLADFLGYSRSSIHRAIKLLEKNGLIKVEKRDRYHCIYSLLKVRCSIYETQMYHQRNSDVAQVDTNNNKLTRNINNIDNEDKKNLNPYSFRGFKPETREELLALDLAKGLNDLRSLPLYLSYAQKYPESLLRKFLGEVREIPIRKIRKGRAALFNYLIKKYVQGAFKNLRD